MNLRKIEHEIEEILSKDTHSWVRLYELIREVEYNKLWRNEYSSFTQWIKHLAYVAGVTESLIWKRKKAGEIYFDYQQRSAGRGVSVPNIEDVEVSPDNFELVEKISQGNNQIKDELMQKVLAKDIKRSDLVNTWSTIKTIQAKEGGKIVKKNRYSKIDSSDKQIFTISDFSFALSESSWLQSTNNSHHKGKSVYKLVPNFSFYSSLLMRYITLDFLLLENVSNKYTQELNTHSIEIVLSDSNLNNIILNPKTNYSWIVVPEDILSLAYKIIPEEIGLLKILSERKIQVVKPAKLNNETSKLDILQAFIVKNI
ncbi:hypothetical protein ACP3C4_002924 [Enterococcus faecalis]|nr:hypothetical protein [Enterococcus faecalis]HCV7884967.1 hypothetical protein [Staphylococcus aureus]EGO5024454.1 hypothetical protein [Enterococcus faecalis]EGO8073366.1 hypothetical protein [Enterococcus faecalis]EGO8139054.1 hypothetical protein [Enterococcus faecalis]EGO8509076.1 hypothetical protein [Enterococcus faecalis]